MLLEYNANTNAQSTGGFTPLHLSCQDGHSDMTTLLLANHADPNAASKCHLTPLHLCAQEDRVKCAEALVNKNADTDAQTLVSKGDKKKRKNLYRQLNILRDKQIVILLTLLL
jgi:ankyrin repeat protein